MQEKSLIGKVFIVNHVTSLNIPNMISRPIVGFTTVREANRVNKILNKQADGVSTYEVETISCFEKLNVQMLGKIMKEHIF